MMETIFWAVVLILGLLGLLWLAPVQCHSQWDNSGMEVSWGIVKGCMVKTKDGKWIPADNYRNID
jgi:hypothetical protein